MRKVRREHPDALLVLTGCYPQAYPDEAAAIPEADLVLGTKHRSRLPGLLAELCQNHARIAAVDSYGAQDDFEALPCDTMPDNTRAFLKIQDGCNCFCQLLHHSLCPWTLPEPAAGGTAESRRRICGERLSGDRPLRHQPGLLRHGVGRLAGRGGGDLCRRPRRGACPAGVSRTGAADGRTACLLLFQYWCSVVSLDERDVKEIYQFMGDLDSLAVSYASLYPDQEPILGELRENLSLMDACGLSPPNGRISQTVST